MPRRVLCATVSAASTSAMPSVRKMMPAFSSPVSLLPAPVPLSLPAS